jgi:protein involved in polysaccharide export with SLBB domain
LNKPQNQSTNANMKTWFCLLMVTFLSLALSSTSAHADVEQLLRKGDSIIVKLSGVPPEETTVVSNTYDVSDNGTINLPHIGEVRAAGTKPSTLQKNIDAAYKSAEIYTHPTIQVTLNRGPEGGTQVIFVSGEVKMPKAVPITPGMTVMDTITAAGGPTDFGNMRKVKFMRGGASRVLDLKKADGPDAQITVQPGDKVHVTQ